MTTSSDPTAPTDGPRENDFVPILIPIPIKPATMLIVTAALIERDDRMLLTQRPTGVHLAGCWEFPGGKLDPGETPAGCLARELREELGVSCTNARPLTFVHHRYAERELLLLLFRCTIDGEPQALHAVDLGWFTRAEARRLELPAADLPLLDFLDGRG